MSETNADLRERRAGAIGKPGPAQCLCGAPARTSMRMGGGGRRAFCISAEQRTTGAERTLLCAYHASLPRGAGTRQLQTLELGGWSESLQGVDSERHEHLFDGASRENDILWAWIMCVVSRWPVRAVQVCVCYHYAALRDAKPCTKAADALSRYRGSMRERVAVMHSAKMVAPLERSFIETRNELALSYWCCCRRRPGRESGTVTIRNGASHGSARS